MLMPGPNKTSTSSLIQSRARPTPILKSNSRLQVAEAADAVGKHMQPPSTEQGLPDAVRTP